MWLTHVFVNPFRGILNRLALFSAALVLLWTPGAAGQCPTGSIPSFGLENHPQGSYVIPYWSPPAGASASTTYLVNGVKSTKYCNLYTSPIIGFCETAATTCTIPLDPNSAYLFYVLVKFCGVSTPYSLLVDSFSKEVGVTTLITSNPSKNLEVLDYSYPDGSNDSAYGVFLNRRQGPIDFTEDEDGQHFEQIADAAFGSCPEKGQFKDTLSAGDFNFDIQSYRFYGYEPKVFGRLLAIGPRTLEKVTVAGDCLAPAAPTLSLDTPDLIRESGAWLLVRWTPSSRLGMDGSYLVEASLSSTFSSLVGGTDTNRFGGLARIVFSPEKSKDFTLYVRVRAVQGCLASASSNVLTIPIIGDPRVDEAIFIAVQSSLDFTAATTDLFPPSAASTFKNVGGTSGRLNLSTTGAFAAVISPSFLDIPPGGFGSAIVTVGSSDLQQPAGFQYLFARGDVVGTWETGVLTVPMTLTVTPARIVAGSRAGSKVKASKTTVSFVAPSGQNPASQTVTLTVDPVVGAGPLYLSPSIGPGGSWLVLGNELSSPLLGAGSRTLTLSVDRSKRTATDGAPPLRALLTVLPLGGSLADAAIIEVLDNETSSVVSGGGRTAAPTRAPLAAPPGGTSFILPTSVKAAGQAGATFTSDGWLKNVSGLPRPVDFYYTPDGESGLTGAVLKTSRTVPAGGILRLSDLLGSLFQVDGTSGQVEMRTIFASSFSLRSAVESVTAGDPASRYGTEIPVVSYGAGIGKGEGELLIPGIDDDAGSRANLILAATSGAGATVEVSVNTAGGQLVGKTTRVVPPYGKIQINGLVNAVSPGATLSGGWAGVKVTDGSGRVVPLATVIDNQSNSFSAIKGRVAGASPRLVIPSGVRLTGAFNTQYTTGLSLVNGASTAANLTLTYFYIDVDDGGNAKSVTKGLLIPARGALQKSVGHDVLASLFGVSNRSYGWIKVEGDVGRVVAVAAISALVDPDDPSKGVKTAQVDGVLARSPDVMIPNQEERRFAGLEKSLQRRSNFIMVETSAHTCDVLVRLEGPTGLRLAERTFSLEANQYLQINDVFGDEGLQLGEGPFQNVEVSARVVSGLGQVVGVATVIDNVSKNPEIFVLKKAGPPPAVPSF